MSEAEPQLELQVGGAVPLDSGVYIARRTDTELLRALEQGEYCNVLCPRQMGKTSAIFRVRATLRSDGWRTALIDIAGRLGTPANAEDWYLGLLSQLTSQFQLGSDLKVWWTTSAEPTPNQKLLAFFREEILARYLGERFVVFLDEIDHTLNLPYTDDFFLAIRSLYNDRAAEPDLRRLTFCLVGVFTPNELIKQQRTTTYNVGRTFELQDFDSERDDLKPLARTLSDDPAYGDALLRAVLRWTGGQPYLTASACKKVAAAGLDSPEAVDRLVEEAFLSHEKPLEDIDGTHFENISRFLGQRVSARLETVQLYRRILRGREERERPTPPVLALKLSGLVKTDRNARLVVRNEIYRRRFDAKWAAGVVPIGDRWGRAATIALAAIVLVLAGMGYFWLRPIALAHDLSQLTEDYPLAETKWKQLQKIPLWSERADELWATYFRRRAERAEFAEDRDAALLWRVRAIQTKDNELDRRAVGSLVLDDYPALEQTLRHEGPVGAIAFSPDGESVLTGSNDRTARLWNARTGEPIGQPLNHGFSVWAVAFSPDGESVLTGSIDNTARLWNARTGAPIGQPLNHGGSVSAVAFSPDGESVLTGSIDNTARLWNARTGAPIGQPLNHGSSVRAVAFSPDGESVLTGSDDHTARLWNARTGAPIGQPLNHGGSVSAVAFSPDGKSVLTGSNDSTARLWNARTGAPIGQPLNHGGSVSAVAFSPDGESVLTGSVDNTARLWNARTGAPIGQPLKHGGYVSAVAFSPDGKSVLTGSDDSTARLWNARTGAPIGQPLKHGGYVSAVAFSPDGESVLTGSVDNTVRLWNARTGQPIGQPLNHGGYVRAVAFSPDSESVLTGSDDNTARLWNARTGAPIGQPLNHSGSVWSVAFSPDGESVLTGSDDTARLWNARTGEPIGQPLNHGDSVWAVAFSPDGESVLTGSVDKTARLWNARTGQPIGQPLNHSGSVRAVAFSPDGESVLTGSVDKTARLWNARTGQPIGQPLNHSGYVRAVAFSPDGKSVLTGSDKTARLWNARTGQPIGQPLNHRGAVSAVAFSPDGRRLLTATDSWIYEFESPGAESRLIRSRFVGKMSATGSVHIASPSADRLLVLTVAGGPRLRTVSIDFADAAPLVGAPDKLLNAWQKKLGLQIDSQGRLMTATKEQWTEGLGILRFSVP